MAEGSKTAGWVRVAMPSAADLVFVALLGVLVFTPLAVRLLGDAGIGWHIRTGQQILATRAIPHVDSFSSTMQGEPWFAWEWLYDVVVGQLESALGLNGVVCFTAVVIAGVFAWLFRLLLARGTNFVAALVLTLLAMSAAMIHFLARPHVVSWLFTLAWFWILDSTERGGGRRRIWLLPLIMLVWVNVHGGFVVGFVLLGIFWVGAVWSWWTAREGRIEEALGKISAGKLARELAWVGAASVAASLVNPYGWNLHAHVYSYLTNRFLMDHIEEFQSPNFHGIAQTCFLLLLLIVVATLATQIPTLAAKKAARTGHPQRLWVSGVLTVLFAIYAGLYASRNIPVSAVLLVMVVGPLLPEVGFARGFTERMAAVEASLRGHLWPIVAVIATFVIAANGGRLGSTQLMHAHFDAKRMPVAAVDFLKTQHVAGPVLSPDYWGGYLIYRMWPARRVVLDDRHDLYGEDFFRSYLKMVHVEQGWREFLRDHPAGCVVMPRDAALTNVLLETPEWKAIYQDDTAVVFVSGGAGSNR
jgi:hypothetical protein